MKRSARIGIDLLQLRALGKILLWGSEQVLESWAGWAHGESKEHELNGSGADQAK
jgi:hypothetical protein